MTPQERREERKAARDRKDQDIGPWQHIGTVVSKLVEKIDKERKC